MLSEYDGPFERIEQGFQTDCEAQGCDPPHSDNGRFWPWPKEWGDIKKHLDIKPNNHEVRFVERTVSYGPWRPIC